MAPVVEFPVPEKNGYGSFFKVTFWFLISFLFLDVIGFFVAENIWKDLSPYGFFIKSGVAIFVMRLLYLIHLVKDIFVSIKNESLTNEAAIRSFYLLIAGTVVTAIVRYNVLPADLFSIFNSGFFSFFGIFGISSILMCIYKNSFHLKQMFVVSLSLIVSIIFLFKFTDLNVINAFQADLINRIDLSFEGLKIVYHAIFPILYITAFSIHFIINHIKPVLANIRKAKETALDAKIERQGELIHHINNAIGKNGNLFYGIYNNDYIKLDVDNIAEHLEKFTADEREQLVKLSVELSQNAINNGVSIPKMKVFVKGKTLKILVANKVSKTDEIEQIKANIINGKPDRIGKSIVEKAVSELGGFFKLSDKPPRGYHIAVEVDIPIPSVSNAVA